MAYKTLAETINNTSVVFATVCTLCFLVKFKKNVMWSPGLAGWRLFLWPSAPLCIVLHCKPHCATSAWPILTQTALHCRSAGGDLEHSNEIQRTVTNHQYLMSWGWTKEFYVEVNFARRIGSQLVWHVTNKQTNKKAFCFENVLDICCHLLFTGTVLGVSGCDGRKKKRGDLHVLAWLHCWRALQTRSGTREQNMRRGCVMSLSTPGLRAQLILQLAKSSLSKSILYLLNWLQAIFQKTGCSNSFIS